MFDNILLYISVSLKHILFTESSMGGGLSWSIPHQNSFLQDLGKQQPKASTTGTITRG